MLATKSDNFYCTSADQPTIAKNSLFSHTNSTYNKKDRRRLRSQTVGNFLIRPHPLCPANAIKGQSFLLGYFDQNLFGIFGEPNKSLWIDRSMGTALGFCPVRIIIIKSIRRKVAAATLILREREMGIF